jgi:hypothetical protein
VSKSSLKERCRTLTDTGINHSLIFSADSNEDYIFYSAWKLWLGNMFGFWLKKDSMSIVHPFHTCSILNKVSEDA